MVKKLYIFNRENKRISLIHNFWDELWFPVEDYCKTYNFDTQKAIIVDKNINEFNNDGEYIQPQNWDSETSNAYEYIDYKELSRAKITGVIKKTGTEEIIPDVIIKLKNNDKVIYQDSSDNEGNYLIENIYPKIYEISFEKTGYITHIEDISISIDETISKNINMEVK